MNSGVNQQLDDLRVQARYWQDKRDLYRAKAYDRRPTSLARLREFERAAHVAETRLRQAEGGTLELGGGSCVRVQGPAGVRARSRRRTALQRLIDQSLSAAAQAAQSTTRRSCPSPSSAPRLAAAPPRRCRGSTPRLRRRPRGRAGAA